MEFKLTQEQYDKLKEEHFIDISAPDKGIRLYVEFDRDMNLEYLESYDTSRPKQSRSDYALGREDLQLLIPKKPTDPSWYSNSPLCPNCYTYMIYHFEHCPRCGQHLDWSGFTGSI